MLMGVYYARAYLEWYVRVCLYTLLVIMIKKDQQEP